jgi:hypothetical protein
MVSGRSERRHPPEPIVSKELEKECSISVASL